MKLLGLLLILFVLVSSVESNAGSENEGKTGMAFLKVGVDARAAGMGEAFSAVTNNAYATYWNPAGLLAANRSNLVFMHNEWLLDVRGEFGAVQFRQKNASFAFHLYSFSVGDIEVREIPTEKPLETTSANYLSAGFSYARPFSNSLDLGITLKYLYEKIFFDSAGGIGVDLGFRYTGFFPDLTFSGSLNNLGKMGKFQSEATKLPKIFRLGAQYNFANSFGPVQLLMAGDVVKPFDENLRFHLGAEAGLWKQLMLRAGYMTGYENRNFSFGVGIRKSFFHLDYSYSPLKDDLGNGHRFSFYLAI
jgi:hypothetical protein